MSKYAHILAKHEDAGAMPLSEHLNDVASIAETIARHLGLDSVVAWKGAVLHDIGKVSPSFQQKMKREYREIPGFVFRHEIASLFFLSLLDDSEKDIAIEMIAAHHKSVRKDARDLGLLDLDDNEESFAIHSKNFEHWCPDALGILQELGFKVHRISLEEAKANYEYAVSYCKGLDVGYSLWKGVLMASDHLASALGETAQKELDKLFLSPDLSYYNRESELYPLSVLPADDTCRHTLVTAPTGAGKTDFLLRRCRGRVFYTLPFQASINAMYDRIKQELDGTGAQVHLLHAASYLKIKADKLEERLMQRHIGASVKVLTPHQIASVVFGIKGYEAMIVDLVGCDVILDEIHTYSDTVQAIVLRIIEILNALGCRIHIGTATMPSILYDQIFQLLGGTECVYEVRLGKTVLDTFNRHIVYKSDTLESCQETIRDAIRYCQKVLVVCNQVKRAQDTYQNLKVLYPDVKMMLLHSRFKRGRRQTLETQLKHVFNTMEEACIVVSTQVVEVSLDISFDLMVTECAPIDALIQRFGRVNRKRTKETIGKYKPVYVVAPSNDESDAKPYHPDVLKCTFDVLPDNGQLLKETEVQQMLDRVYTDCHVENIDYSGAVFCDGKWNITKLYHRTKSALLDALDIDSAVCITENDRNKYKMGCALERSAMEIPVSYRSIKNKGLEQLSDGLRPFVIPDKAYSDELGFQADYAKPEYYKTFEMI